MESEWKQPESDTLSKMNETLEQSQLVPPIVPRWMAQDLREHSEGWAWSTDPEIDPWAVYSLFGEASEPQLERLLEPQRPDFFLTGHRGHGINSYGFGVVARIGPLFVAQQHGWGGVYMDENYSRANVNGANEIWGTTMRAVTRLLNEELRIAVIYSRFRGHAQIWQRTGGTHSPDDGIDWVLVSSEKLRLPEWSVLVSDGRDAGRDHLVSLVDNPDLALALAARYLLELLDLEEKNTVSVDEPSEGD